MQLAQAVTPQGLEGRLPPLAYKQVLQRAHTHVAVAGQLRHAQRLTKVIRDVAIGALDQLLRAGGSDQHGLVEKAGCPQSGSEPKHTEISPFAPPTTTLLRQTISNRAPNLLSPGSSPASLKGRFL
jgi:hypothetical protein